MDLRELPTTDDFRRHPWETVRASFFRRILRGVDAGDGADILDVGAGDGWLTGELLKEFSGGNATCWDTHYQDSGTVDGRDIRFTTERPEGQFDAVFLLDLLEHVEDDRGFLSGVVADLARPGALVLVSVPAWNGLYCTHDAAFTHHRRYSPSELRSVLRDAGLSVVREGGLFHTLLLPRTVTVVRERIFGTGDVVPKPLYWRHGELGARFLERALGAETAFSSFVARLGLVVPGLSHWALCRKGPQRDRI